MEGVKNDGSGDAAGYDRSNDFRPNAWDAFGFAFKSRYYSPYATSSGQGDGSGDELPIGFGEGHSSGYGDWCDTGSGDGYGSAYHFGDRYGSNLVFSTGDGRGFGQGRGNGNGFDDRYALHDN